MRIRIHPDVAKKVNTSRKRNGGRSANQEVNMALIAHYAGIQNCVVTMSGLHHDPYPKKTK